MTRKKGKVDVIEEEEDFEEDEDVTPDVYEEITENMEKYNFDDEEEGANERG